MEHLHIYEEVLLLALRDEEGTTHFGVNYQYALAGAIIAELLLDKKIGVETSGKKKFIKLLSHKYTGDEILDESLKKLKTAKRKAQVTAWVGRIAGLRRLKHRAAESLCRKGILKMEEGKVLLLFKRKTYPEINPKPEKLIIGKIQKAIFTEQKDIDPEVIILISICESTGLLKPLFDKKELRSRKDRIKQITSGTLIGKATKEAIEAVQAAVMVATIIPVVTVTTTGG